MAWIGIDFDGTLAYWTGHPPDVLHVGAPIPRMVERVRALIAAGEDVRIFTARVAMCGETSSVACDDQAFADNQRQMIEAWCLEYLGCVLRVTATKDWQMKECWDDRVKQVITNQGVLLEDVYGPMGEGL